jgi:hypothetical protein
VKTYSKTHKKKTKKLAQEKSKRILKFDLCNEYIVDAGNYYQACYTSIIKLAIEQQAFLKQNNPVSSYIETAINAAGVQITAGGGVNTGHTITNVYNSATGCMEEIKKGLVAQKKLEELKINHACLQQKYENKKKELISKNEELEKQKNNLSEREQGIL